MPTLPITRSQVSHGSRKKSGVRASAANVATVSPNVLRAPTLNVPKAAFDTTLGAAEELAPGLEEASASIKRAEKNSQNRKDTVGRARIELAYTNEFDALYRDFIAEKDFSTEADKIEFVEMGTIPEEHPTIVDERTWE